MAEPGRPGAATLGELIVRAKRDLARAGVEQAGLDARLIVGHFAQTTPTDAIARPDMAVAADRVALVDQAVRRRCAGEPVHRILGRREFYGLELGLSEATLEPRPDTEALVDLALERFAAQGREAPEILDLGAGTGAIALAILSRLPGATALGVDLAEDAVETANRNAARLGIGDRFSARRSDWFAEVSGRYDAILSNPPYIRRGDLAALPVEVRRHDPSLALDGGVDGLDAYRVIAADAHRHLRPDGFVAVEIGWDQRDAVVAIFAACGFSAVRERRDIAGRDRALLFEPVQACLQCGKKPLGIRGENI